MGTRWIVEKMFRSPKNFQNASFLRSSLMRGFEIGMTYFPMLTTFSAFPISVDESNGAVELAPGSQRLGFVRHQRSGGFFAVAREPPVPEPLSGRVPPLQPGDVLFFTDLTLHRSGANKTREARWSADWAYELADDDTICPPLSAPGVLAFASAKDGGV